MVVCYSTCCCLEQTRKCYSTSEYNKAHLNDSEVLSIYKCSVYDASCKMAGKAKIMSLCQIKILDQLQSFSHSKALQVNVMAFDSIGIFYMSSFG